MISRPRYHVGLRSNLAPSAVASPAEVAQPVEERARLPLHPVDLERALVRELHAPVRDVAPHPEQRERAGRHASVGENLRDLRREVDLGLSAQEPDQDAGRDRLETPERARPLARLDEPAHELRETGVLDVEAAALAAVERVGDVERAR